jgi:hypothetical protein
LGLVSIGHRSSSRRFAEGVVRIESIHAQRCDLVAYLLDLFSRQPGKFFDRPDEVHHGVRALSVRRLAAKDLLGELASRARAVSAILLLASMSMALR